MATETVASPGTSVPSQVAEASSAGTARLCYIDNMRAGLITLVIVGHMAITYGAPTGDWYYRETGDVGAAFTIITLMLLGIGASFLLGLFFMIAGYFSPHPYDRKGAWHFILDRLIRLGIPLLLYALVINPLVTYWAAVHGGYEGSFLHYVPSHLQDLRNAAVGPLWFVEALLVFSIVYALGRRLIELKSSFPPREQPLVRPPSNGAIGLFALGLGLATFLVRVWAPFGWWWEPLHQEPAHLPQYVALFAIGMIAYRNNWFDRIPSIQARHWGWLALALVPMLPALAIAAGALRGEFDPAVAGGLTWLSLAYSFWEACIGTALVIAVLVWFRNRFNRRSRLLAGMSAAAYAVYVLHPLVIVPLALALSPVRLRLDLKFVVVAPFAVVLCFLTGHLVRRLPVIRRIL